MSSEPPNLSQFPIVMISFGLILAILAFVFSGMLDSIENPNQQVVVVADERGGQQVLLTRNKYGHYVATGLINGQEVTFFVDTGATLVAIPEHIANNLGLKKGVAFQTQTANGLSRSYQTRIDSLTLGNIVMTDVAASISTGMEFDEILLGMSFLKHLKLVQQGNTLSLSVPENSF